MAYQRKTRDIWRFYVDYGQGWEYEGAEYSRAAARQTQREYAQNCPQYPTKIVKGRERIKEAQECTL